MQKYQQVVFVSTINDASPLVKRDILSQFNEDAMTYFQRGDITGLLFYGNDHFFHYFESDAKRMEQLKADVLAYPHHHNQQLIYNEKAPQKKFNSWQMKYTQNDPLVQAFFARHGWERFDPYLLQGELLDEFMAIVMTYADSSELITGTAKLLQHHINLDYPGSGNVAGPATFMRWCRLLNRNRLRLLMRFSY
jgi:hypothetical protein